MLTNLIYVVQTYDDVYYISHHLKGNLVIVLLLEQVFFVCFLACRVNVTLRNVHIVMQERLCLHLS